MGWPWQQDHVLLDPFHGGDGLRSGVLFSLSFSFGFKFLVNDGSSYHFPQKIKIDPIILYQVRGALLLVTSQKKIMSNFDSIDA